MGKRALAAAAALCLIGASLSGCGGLPGPGGPGHGGGIDGPGGEHWPVPKYDAAANSERVAAAVRTYHDRRYDASRYFVDYSATGSYLQFETNLTYRNGPTVDLDPKGIPKVKYGDQWYYNPVTTEQFALAQYGKALKGDAKAKQAFLDAVDILETLQDDRGAMLYNFEFSYYLSGKSYQPGWSSGMAQGQALSVYARAYQMTHKAEFLDRGNQAFAFMMKPVSEGATLSDLTDLDPSLSAYPILEEFPASPNGYTLNGFMFALLGVYDWWQVSLVADPTKSQEHQQVFEQLVATLTKILPYYDVGGFTAYDLGQYTYDQDEPHLLPQYHLAHIYLLHALVSVTHDQTLAHYEQLWASYVA